MKFTVTVPNLINLIGIAMGIGICGLNLLQVTISAHLRKDVKRYFQAFFTLILLYITTHLARQLMDGLPGSGVRLALHMVTFVEMLTAALMTFMMALLVLSIARRNNPIRNLGRLLLVLVGVHTALLIANCFAHLIFYFDAENVYHRAPLYLLSNLCPLLMMIVSMVLLIRFPLSFSRRVRSAFWTYMIAPLAAIVIQSFTYGVQFIIFATVGAAVYMFLVIIADQNAQYEAQRAESSRLETELSMATRIQADMLPNIFPAFPERREFDIYASMNPAKEVGGDFYDFFLIDEDHLGLVMADVSGKGVPAALFMMASKILVQNYAMMERSPKAALEAANYQICQSNREDMFVTVWLGILDLRTGILIASNAGHEYPALKMPGQNFELYKDRHGFVIGGMTGVKYREYEIQLETGSMLFLYTDGVAEASNAANELFGSERMLSALNRDPEAAPEQVLRNVMSGINDFVDGAEQFDDITMLCLKYNGPEQK